MQFLLTACAALKPLFETQQNLHGNLKKEERYQRFSLTRYLGYIILLENSIHVMGYINVPGDLEII